MIGRKSALGLGVAGTSVFLTVLLGGCHGTRPETLGATGGRLVPCPESPNCVSSYSDDPDHEIAPLAFEGDPSDALARLVQIIQGIDRAEVVTSTDRYIHAEFESRWMGFVDDVEFFVDDQDHVIHVKSASRLGHSDLGVNRERVETLRALLQGEV